jgi:predicted RNase H-like nuclease (RuvC/YqgF family)
MSFLDKIKGAVFEDEPKKAPLPSSGPTIGHISSAPPPAVRYAQATPTDASVAKVNDAPEQTVSDEVLDAHIQAAPAFSTYASFLTLADSMRNVITNEPQRLQATLAAQAASGVSGEAIINSVLSYQEVLKTEEKNFEDTTVANATREIDTHNTEVESLTQQIDNLNARVKELTDRRTDALNASINRTSELQKARADFEATVSRVRSKYFDLVNKLRQHLGVPNA